MNKINNFSQPHLEAFSLASLVYNHPFRKLRGLCLEVKRFVCGQLQDEVLLAYAWTQSEDVSAPVSWGGHVC